MALSKINKTNEISIDVNAIADVVGNAIFECYGILGLAQFDNNGKVILLGEKSNFAKGIICSVDRKGNYEIRINLFVAYGIKITEIVSEVRNRVKYVTKQVFDIDFSKVNIFVEGIK